MIKKCYAKLNLTLDSLYKRDDSYHEIDSIMVRISLFDKLEIKKNKINDIRIFTNSKQLENMEDNLVYKAWELLKNDVSDCGVDIKLEKNIPFAAGLAGGSTDAAETLKALNEIWDLSYSKDQLMKKAKSLGADLPFFFMEKPARARGIGEKLTPFSINLPMYFLLINDGTEISSKYIYERLKDYGHIDTERIIKKLEDADFSAYEDFSNVMENVAFEKFPHLKKIKEEIKENGANTSLMSGSGASIFGVFSNKKDLDRAFERLENKYKFVKKVTLAYD